MNTLRMARVMMAWEVWSSAAVAALPAPAAARPAAIFSSSVRLMVCAPPTVRAALARLLVRTVPKIATPMVWPIWRKNCVLEVATPISRGDTAFCTARL